MGYPRLVSVPIVVALVLRAAVAHGSFTVDQVVEDLNLPADAAERIRSGGMVHSAPTESSEREIAVGLAFIVQHPLAEGLKAFLAAVDLKADPQLSASVPIRGPGTLADFASLVLEPDGVPEAKRYLGAHAGDTHNLSAEEIQAFKALDANDRDPKTRVEDQLKRLLVGRYQAYLANGLDGVAPYARGSGPREPSEELRRATQASRLLELHAPALQQVLLSYPKEKPAGLEDHFYWLCYTLDGRPNYTLRQRMALAVGEVFAVADREFYVSHGYNTSQAIAGFIPVPEGTMVVHQSRVSTDQVGGFTSSMKKGIGRGVMAKQLTDIFERSRDSFQQRRSVPRSQ